MRRSAKVTTLPLRLSAVERAAMERAAERAHLPLSTWVRQQALEAAELDAGADERRARVREFLDRLRAGTVKGARGHAAAVAKERREAWRR